MKGNSDSKLVFYPQSVHERWGPAQDNVSLGSHRSHRSWRLTSLDCHCIRLGKVGGGEGGTEKGEGEKGGRGRVGRELGREREKGVSEEGGGEWERGGERREGERE